MFSGAPKHLNATGQLGGFPYDFVYLCPIKGVLTHVTTKSEDPSWSVHRDLPDDPHVFILVCPTCFQQHKVRDVSGLLTVETVYESNLVERRLKEGE